MLLKGKREFPGGLAVKDLALSLPWLGFDPWPENFRMLQAIPPHPKKRNEVLNLDIKTLCGRIRYERPRTVGFH